MHLAPALLMIVLEQFTALISVLMTMSMTQVCRMWICTCSVHKLLQITTNLPVQALEPNES